jgi:hypothetical protein
LGEDRSSEVHSPFHAEPRQFAHCRKLHVCPVDHPRSELHNLLRRKNPLCNKSADNHLTDPERSGGLLHGSPQPLIWWWTGRKAVCMADMLHALLRPSVAVAGAIAQPVQDRNNRRVFTEGQSSGANLDCSWLDAMLRAPTPLPLSLSRPRPADDRNQDARPSQFWSGPCLHR